MHLKVSLKNMNNTTNENTDSTLIIDIGSGTQDVLLYQREIELENCFKLVLPSPTQTKAIEIRNATRQKTSLFLSGRIMGGGACAGAIKNHLKDGLTAYATEQAAKTINDNLNRIQTLGVKLVKVPPENSVGVVLEDIDIAQWRRFFKLWSMPFPARFAIAVQDHGDSPDSSNRILRMSRWQTFMDSGGCLDNLVYRQPPEGLTRMKAVSQTIGKELILMDTGAAAICGIIEDPVVASRQDQGVVLINLGNNHTLIAVLRGEKLLGLCEHHTSRITPDKLAMLVEKLVAGSLTHQEVFDDKGHGTALAKEYSGLSFSPMIAVTGPKRKLCESLSYYHAVPHGDMMLSGCFGLLKMGRKIGFIP
jgi:uncharacterized protein (DUF1786 family)